MQVAESGECKVADFGLSAVQGSILASNKIYKRIRPPEVSFVFFYIVESFNVLHINIG